MIGQDHRDGSHALLPAAEPVVMPVFQLCDIQPGQHVIDTAVSLFPGHTIIQRGKQHIFVYGRHEHLLIGVLHDKTEFPPDGRKILRYDRKTSDSDLSAALFQAAQQFQYG